MLDTLNDILWLRLVLDAHEADSNVFNGPTVGSSGLSRKMDGVLVWPFVLRWLIILGLGSCYILDIKGPELL